MEKDRKKGNVKQNKLREKCKKYGRNNTEWYILADNTKNRKPTNLNIGRY